MKKRLLVISLALALVLTTLAPAAPALAKPEKTSFTGAGLVFASYVPDPIIKGDKWYYQEEVVQGFLSVSDWDLLVGASFYSVHDSKVEVDEAGNIEGKMEGTFILIRPDGTLEGTFSGKITGSNYFDVTVTIADEGKWKSTQGTGVFEGVKAKGTWSANLHYGPTPTVPPFLTLVGPLTWNGEYESGKEPKPSKPWKPDHDEDDD